MKKALIFAAVAEAATGLALVLVPSLVGQLLLGAELTGAALPVARVTGIALIALGVACWPGPPLAGMLVYTAFVMAYLAYVGFGGEWAARCCGRPSPCMPCSPCCLPGTGCGNPSKNLNGAEGRRFLPTSRNAVTLRSLPQRRRLVRECAHIGDQLRERPHAALCLKRHRARTCCWPAPRRPLRDDPPNPAGSDRWSCLLSHGAPKQRAHETGIITKIMSRSRMAAIAARTLACSHFRTGPDVLQDCLSAFDPLLTLGAAEAPPPRRNQLDSDRRRLEMQAKALVDLLDRRFGGGHVAQCVQQHEIMDGAVVAHGIDLHARFFQLSGVSLTFVAQRTVLSCDDERRRGSPFNCSVLARSGDT